MTVTTEPYVIRVRASSWGSLFACAKAKWARENFPYLFQESET